MPATNPQPDPALPGTSLRLRDVGPLGWVHARRRRRRARADVAVGGGVAAARGRRAGATDAQLEEAAAAGIPLAYYASAIEAGATHAETLEVHGAGASVHFYAWCRQRALVWAPAIADGRRRLVAGGEVATHVQALEAHRAGLALNRYAWIRKDLALDHGAAMALTPGPLRGASVATWELAATAYRALVAGGQEPAAAVEAVRSLAPGWPGTVEDLVEGITVCMATPETLDLSGAA